MVQRLLLMLAIVPLAARGGVLAGELALSSSGRPLAAHAAREAVVYFRPRAGHAGHLDPGVFEMRTAGKRFVPETLVVAVGSRVAFPNSDPILHNVFSLSGRNSFDLGLLAQGEGGAHTFTRPGLVRVFCNVHHQMSGHVVVLDTPYVARPDADGRFTLDIPDGMSGELSIWHPRAALWRRTLTVARGQARLQVAMALTRPRVPPHTNKLGRPYEQAGAYAP